ncbi:hypothetical protein H8F01_16575 [Dyella telluris]|uniref:Uncharacterized protein n=1 Tax=Dyella telluris TaxID=2763498 RepID=A0A7G8QAR8_9GAMM|nr:hypothetical protein H8F01_16575 [Dyella telluris]
MLAFVLILHVLFAVALWHEMQPRAQKAVVTPLDTDQALIVRLISRPKAPRAAQVPEPPQPPSPARAAEPPRPVAAARTPPVTLEKPHHDAMVVQDHAAAPAPATSAPSAINLFSKGGSIRLPSTADNAPAPASASTAAKATDDRQIMQHDSNRMQYKATRFEKYFPPPNETAGGAVGRHVGDALKEIAKSVCDPTKKSTAFNPLCAAPPPPASPMNRDERLNLPPAPLVSGIDTGKTPPLSGCIKDYRDGKPLVSGCPINTPELAFKAEMRECIDLYRAGKRLKSWCPLDTPKRAAAESPAPAESSSVAGH